jgi:hypothetical protein
MKIGTQIFMALFFVIFVSCVGSFRPIEPQQLVIGGTLPCTTNENTEETMISSGQFAPFCTVRSDGVIFTIASVDRKTIAFISTNDSTFVSPEGVAIGVELNELKAKYGLPLRVETGWAFYIVLPSGWCASFPQDTTKGIIEPASNAKVSWFFKRRGSA